VCLAGVQLAKQGGVRLPRGTQVARC